MSGLFVETALQLPMGTQVRIELQLLNSGKPDPVVVDGLVARCVEPAAAPPAEPALPGLGIHFERFVYGEQLLREVLDALERPMVSQQQAAAAEQRGSPRVRTGIHVLWGTEDPPTREGYISNLSDRGAFVVHTCDPCAEGTRVYLKFTIPHLGEPKEIRTVGTALRLRALEGLVHGMGMVFELSAVDVEHLSAFLAGRHPDREKEQQRSWLGRVMDRLK